MQELKILGLGRNKLMYLPVDVFSTYKNLCDIELSENEIEELSPRLFDNNLNLLHQESLIT